LINLYRIADARHPIWDGQGAALFGGRWNSAGQPVIYASLVYSCAMLEVLVHASIGRAPKNHQYVVANVPDSVSVELRKADSLPAGWADANGVVARNFGDKWLAERRSAVLIVPSVVAHIDFNALVNPAHPDFGKITTQAPTDVVWDQRLFTRGLSPGQMS
jgi:RES domain-containing protein